MNHRQVLRAMGVPVWRLRAGAMAMRLPEEDGAGQCPGVSQSPVSLVLEVDQARGQPGQALLDELQQAVELMGGMLDVCYRPGELSGLRLGEWQGPSMARLLRQPELKARVWRQVCKYIDERRVDSR